MTLKLAKSAEPSDASGRPSARHYQAQDLAYVSRAFWWLANRFHRLPPSAYLLWNSPDYRALRAADGVCDFQAQLKKYIAKHKENSHVDYSARENFVLYDHAYFYRNFFKSLVAADFVRHSFPHLAKKRHVVDLGAGIGTFSIACKLMHTFDHATYTLVDENKFQLDLAKLLTHDLHFSSFFYVNSDVTRAASANCLAIASYWLCCNNEAVLGRSERDLGDLFKYGLVLVDYDVNVRAMKEKLTNLGRDLYLAEISADVPAEIQPLIGGQAVNVHMLVLNSIT